MDHKKRFWILLVFTALFPTIGSGQNSKTIFENLDSTIITLHQKKLFSGAVLVAKNGKITYQKYLGYEDFRTKKTLTLSSAFNLKHFSELFVYEIISELLSKKEINLTDKVFKYLPEFPYSEISISHLLNHTSGIESYSELATKYNNTLDTLTNESALKLLFEIKPALKFKPESQKSYSNSNALLLVAIIEKITKNTFQEAFEDKIIRRFQLKNTFIFKLKNINQPSRTIGYKRVGGKETLFDLTRFDGILGNDNVYSSIEDFYSFINSAKYLNTEYFTLLNSVHFQNCSKIKLINLPNQQTLIFSNSSHTDAIRTLINVVEGKNFRLPSSQLIKNVQLIDGTGANRKTVDVRIFDDKIFEIGELQMLDNEQFTDGLGMILAPGFIDSHSHHFGGLFKVPHAIPTLNQGITTIVIGQDGSSYPMDTLETFFKQKNVAVNIASYTGHSTLRSQVMGTKSLYRTAKPSEVKQMGEILETELQKGSFGLNTGLEYESAFFSNRDEVLELAKIASKYKGRYMSHIRSEDINLLESIEEIIEIGKKANIPVQISHIKIAKKDQWKTSNQILSKLQKARAEGINITADCYPYNYWNSTLRVLFPNRDYENLESAEFAVKQLFDPNQSVLVRFAPNKEYAGKTLSQIAEIRHETPALTLIKLIQIAAKFEEENPDFNGGIEAIMGKSMDDEDVNNLLKWSHTNICSDGSSSGHPRGHGAFTRILGKYVRQEQIFSLETAINKMTALTAEHLGISDRGIVDEGYFADLVLFDPSTVIDNADIKDGKALSSGILKVWVNGQMVWDKMAPTGNLSGVLIKRK